MTLMKIRSGRALCQLEALLLAASTLSACGREPQQLPQRGEPKVSVMAIEPKDAPVSFEFIAQAQSSRQVSIQARVNGFLDRRVYTEGTPVKAGQTLFLMDRKPFQAQLDQAKAVLQQQQATLDSAKSNLERTKPLVEQNALSQKDLDDATSQYKQTAAATASARAQVVQAELNLSYTTITSPVAGMSSFAQQADGTYLGSSNSQLTTVSVLSPIWVNFSISETQLQRLREAVAKGLLEPPPDNNYLVEVLFADGTVFPETGHITFLQPDYDPKTATFLVRVSLANKSGLLRPNQYLRARVTGATRPHAVAIPQRAVQQGPRGHFVWVMDAESKVEARPIEAGEWSGENWFINQGLATGEQVVVDGAQTLTTGAKVAATPIAGARP